MTKEDVINEIDKRIETYEKRINIRKNQPCYFDETKRIESFESKIEMLEDTKEYINKIS